MSQESAETIALRALAWLAGNEDLMPVFLAATGASVDDLKIRAQETEFLGSILDFILMDDAWIIGFCTDDNLPNEAPMMARAALPGGTQVHWT